MDAQISSLIIKRVSFYLILLLLLSACGKNTAPYLPVKQHKSFITSTHAFYRDNLIVLNWEVDKNIAYNNNLSFQILESVKNNCIKCQKKIVAIKKKRQGTQNSFFEVNWKRYKNISFDNIENFYEVKIPISYTKNIFFAIKEYVLETEKIIFFPPLQETYIPEPAQVIEIQSIDEGKQRAIYLKLFHPSKKQLFFAGIKKKMYYIFFRGNAIYPFKKIAIRDSIIKLPIGISTTQDESLSIAVENAVGNQSSKVLVDIGL